jgi:hypothetical protein
MINYERLNAALVAEGLIPSNAQDIRLRMVGDGGPLLAVVRYEVAITETEKLQRALEAAGWPLVHG